MTHEKGSSGFALLEVMVAGAIAIGIIFALFSAIRQADSQTRFVERKMDERTLISDLNFVLQNATLCKDRFELHKDYQKKDDVRIGVQNHLEVGAGVQLPTYGVRVDSLKVVDALQISEDRTYAPKSPDCIGILNERLETRNGVLVVVFPVDPRQRLCFGWMSTYHKEYYVDLEIRLSALRQPGPHFRPERLVRVQINRDWKQGDFTEKSTCLGVNSGKDTMSPTYYSMMMSRVGAKPGTALQGNVAPLPGGSSSSAAIAAAVPPPPKDDTKPSFDHHWNVDNRQDAAQTAPSPEASRDPASVAAAAPAPKTAPPAVVEEKKPPRNCAVDVTLEEAIARGYPTYKSGEQVQLEAGNCEESHFMCWDGQMIDEGRVKVPGCVPKAIPVAASQ